MKALAILAPLEARVIEIEEPTPRDDEVLIRVDRVGLCGSDLTTFMGKIPW